MSQINSVTFTPTLDDTLAAFESATRLSWWRFVFLGLLFGAMLGMAGFLQAPFSYDMAAAVCGGVAFPPLFVLLLRWKLRRDVTTAFHADAALSEQRTVCWDQSGLSWSTGTANNHLPWSTFVRVQHTRRFVLLWHNRKRFEGLPTRVLTPEALATLEPLLAAIHDERSKVEPGAL